MARSKNRKNMQTQHQSVCYTNDARCRCVQCVTDRNLAGKNSSTPASLGHRNPQDVLDSIEYHWKILSADIKHFLLEGPRSLVDFVKFWSEPHRIENAKGSCATSISGSSWFLALNYLFLDKRGSNNKKDTEWVLRCTAAEAAIFRSLLKMDDGLSFKIQSEKSYV